MKMKRKDMGAHEQDDKAHLHQALNIVVKLQDDLRSATETIASMKKESDDELTSATETIKSLQEKYDNMANKRKPFIFKLTKKMFRTESSTDGYNMCIDVCPNGSGDSIGTHVSAYVCILKGRNDKNLMWPFIGTVQIELLNQLSDQKHHLKKLIFTKEDDINVGESWGFPGFIAHYKLHTGEAQFLKDDTLYFRISVEVAECKHWMEHLKKQAHS